MKGKCVMDKVSRKRKAEVQVGTHGLMKEVYFMLTEIFG